jgi:hypothetical protein
LVSNRKTATFPFGKQQESLASKPLHSTAPLEANGQQDHWENWQIGSMADRKTASPRYDE